MFLGWLCFLLVIIRENNLFIDKSINKKIDFFKMVKMREKMGLKAGKIGFGGGKTDKIRVKIGKN